MTTLTELANHRIAIMLPCYNEELTVGAIIRDFNACLPHAQVYVFDNNSSDATACVARAAGACVRRCPCKAKATSFAACLPISTPTPM